MIHWGSTNWKYIYLKRIENMYICLCICLYVYIHIYILHYVLDVHYSRVRNLTLAFPWSQQLQTNINFFPSVISFTTTWNINISWIDAACSQMDIIFLNSIEYFRYDINQNLLYITFLSKGRVFMPLFPLHVVCVW